MESSAKDDTTVAMKNKEFADNEYWRAPDMYDLDDLLAEVSDPGDAARAEREQILKDIEATESSDPEPESKDEQ